MASSLSLRKGQYPIVCQLCEVDMKLKWKCEDCDLLMCDRCRKKVHPKFKKAIDHRIINIKEVGTHNEDMGSGFELRDVKCQQHSEQNCCLFCQTCEQLICASCVTKTHKPHELVEIREACKINKARLREEKKRLEIELLELDEIETRAEQVKYVETSRYEETKQELCDHQKALKNEVDRYAYELLEKLDGSLQAVDKSLETQQKRVDKIREVLKQRLTLACNALDDHDVIKTLQEGSRVFNSLDQTDEQPFYLETTPVPKLVSSNYKMVDTHLGFLQNTGTSHTVKTDFKIKRKFTTSTNMINVHYIVASANGLWISHSTSQTNNNSLVQKVTPKKDLLETVWSFNVKIYGMALNSEEDLLLCVDESRLKLINGRTGQISDSKYDVSPLVTRAIHVTKNNQIIIAAKNIGTPFPVSGRRVVIKMNENGTQAAVYEYDRRNKPLFTYPDNITSSSKGNIFVIDLFSNKRHSRIVVLEPGRVDPLNVYSGCSEVNSEPFPFKAVALVNTPSDNIIITDRDTHTLHILNSEGHLISLFNLRNIGVVEEPYSLAIDPSGLLYVGCLKADQVSNAAKLYDIKYSGC